MVEDVRVVIADDHAVVRTGLGRLLGHATGVVLVGSAATGEEAVDLVVAVRPDVVLMDLEMPGLGGVEATRWILARAPGVNVVVLSSFADRARILEALDAGAIGYLLKDAEPAELLAAIHSAARGESPITPRVARMLVASRRERRPLDDLTERERTILSLVALGVPNKTIAARCSISEKTVKAHLTAIFRKVGVQNRVAAALWARDHPLV